MKFDIPDECLPLVVTALEHYHAYASSFQREDARYQEAADWFKRRRSPASEEQQPAEAETGLKPRFPF